MSIWLSFKSSEEDIGKMCSFLISDDSSKVSGQEISVDGHTERND